MVVVTVTAGVYMWVFATETNRKTHSSHYLDTQLHSIGLELTFTGRHAIGPPVIDILAANSSAALEPSAARSATTGSA